MVLHILIRIVMAKKFTGIPVSPELRDEIRSLKSGGESYDSLLERMIEQYDPDKATSCE